jgi:arsenical pump membrane protein
MTIDKLTYLLTVLIVQLILAGGAVVAIAVGGTGRGATVAVGVIGLAAVVVGAPALPALEAAAPLIVFLSGALTLAAAAEAAGLADRAAHLLARLAGGSGPALYTLVCLTCAFATAVVTLDGAVVLMVPVLLALSDRHEAPAAPLLLGTVAVANAVSIAVPQGNPTNLVLIERLGISPASFAAKMALPGLAAALVCALGAAVLERRALVVGYSRPAREAGGRAGTRREGEAREAEGRAGTRREGVGREAAARTARAARHMTAALVLAGIATCLAPLAGIPLWWPLPGVAAAALLLYPGPRPRPVLPGPLAVQLTGLLVVIGALGAAPQLDAATGAKAIVALALVVGAVAALANNLPVSVSAGSLLAAGSSGYAATIGLGVGALATPQGSVATLIAADLAGPAASALTVRRLAPLALAGVLTAAVVLAALG